jgi:hypothetical protein
MNVQYRMLINLRKGNFSDLPSFRRKPESSNLNMFEMPDPVILDLIRDRHDDSRTIDETIKVELRNSNILNSLFYLY